MPVAGLHRCPKSHTWWPGRGEALTAILLDQSLRTAFLFSVLPICLHRDQRRCCGMVEDAERSCLPARTALPLSLCRPPASPRPAPPPRHPRKRRPPAARNVHSPYHRGRLKPALTVTTTIPTTTTSLTSIPRLSLPNPRRPRAHGSRYGSPNRSSTRRHLRQRQIALYNNVVAPLSPPSASLPISVRPTDLPPRDSGTRSTTSHARLPSLHRARSSSPTTISLSTAIATPTRC